jgi:hypothetical protein
MDQNQDNKHVLREPNFSTKVCTPLGFHFNNRIDGSIATLVETPTQSSGSNQIDIIFVSAAATEFIF